MIGLTILDRYVFKEIAVSFFFCFVVFCFTGLIAGFLPILQKGMEAGMELTMILFQVLINALPSTLVTVLPLSLTIGILMALGRMSVDNEIAALKSSGISVIRLLPPVAALAIIGVLLSLWCTLVLIPRGIAKGQELMREALSSRMDAGLEERTFFDHLKDLVLYVEHIDSSSGVLTNVFLRESSDPDDIRTIIARKGQVVPDPEGKSVIMNLKDGTILKENRTGDSTGTLAFQTYMFRYKLPALSSDATARSLEEMSVPEILGRVEEAREKRKTAPAGQQQDLYTRIVRLGLIFVTQRYVHPFACMALAAAAFPLGVMGMGKSRLNNVSIGMAVIFLYYALSLSVERMARSGVAPPQLILPLPPLLFIGVGIYMMRCVQMERTPWFARMGQKAVEAVKRRRDERTAKAG
ncbi:MAG: LptF/LptG family permease [Pseudomonadota bacterium]